MIRNRISLFVATFLIIGFFFLALPEKGYSQIVLGGPPCCDVPSLNVCVGGAKALDVCEQFSACQDGSCLFVPNGTCVPDGDSSEFGSCISPSNTPIPTLSEWGLIAMAGIIGTVGYLVIRRRKVSA
jgi:hypothetical protein